jgi:hypothetical protein
MSTIGPNTTIKLGLIVSVLLGVGTGVISLSFYLGGLAKTVYQQGKQLNTLEQTYRNSPTRYEFDQLRSDIGEIKTILNNYFSK